MAENNLFNGLKRFFDHLLGKDTEARLHASGGPFREMTLATKAADKQQAAIDLNAAFSRSYPMPEQAMTRSGYDPRRDYAAERMEGGLRLDEALERTWKEGLEFEVWKDKAARSIGIR